jgi:hypothetical protein
MLLLHVNVQRSSLGWLHHRFRKVIMGTAFAGDSWENEGGAVDAPRYSDVVFDRFTGRYIASVEVEGVVYTSLGFNTAEEAYDEALEMRWYYAYRSAN